MKPKMDIALSYHIKKYNISYILEKYDQVKNSGLKYALVHFNIKNFRYYNTKYGSDTGEELLELLFRTLLEFLEQEEYAAYLYADNFVALMRHEDIDAFVYERMTACTDKLYRINDERIYRNVFFSFGIYQIQEKNIKFQDAFNYANLCRKECDSIANRNYCMEVYNEKFYQDYMGQLELEIKTADAYKNYEFVPFLQPKVNLENEKIVSAEALLRWFDKEGNAVPLYQFLPILNQNSYIILVDLDIFEYVCKLLERRIKNHQKVVPVSFNISKSHFYDPRILQDYIEIFEKYDIPKRLVEIEFMESISLNDTEHMKKVISGFKEYGFTCSLDDFGNGYSSFNVLLNADLDIVKMDRQFFLNNLNGDDKLVIKTMVDLIHSLKMKVVAEGVELKEHVDFLKACGCDYVQGYYYYKPMPLNSFEDILDRQ